jgi:hypothetical protein
MFNEAACHIACIYDLCKQIYLSGAKLDLDNLAMHTWWYSDIQSGDDRHLLGGNQMDD